MNTTFTSSAIPMQTTSSSLNRHNPQMRPVPTAIADPNAEVWDDAKKPCPWLMEKYQRALNYDLPKPAAQALDGWMKASQATAIITALLAAVQGGMIAVLSQAPANDESVHWRTFRGFVYAGLFFDLGATLSSVYITVQGAALPVLARQKAMDASAPTSAPDSQVHEAAPKMAPYYQIHEPRHMMPRDLLDGRHGVQVLEEFGMDRLWWYVAHHMLLNFVLGYICLVISVVIWVCGKESTALAVPVVMIAVFTALPVLGFLRFIGPLRYLLRMMSCVHV